MYNSKYDCYLLAKTSTTTCSHVTKYKDTHKHTLICEHPWSIHFKQAQKEESKEAKISLPKCQRKGQMTRQILQLIPR